VEPWRAIRRSAFTIAILAVLYALGLGFVFRALIGLPLAARLAISTLIIAPVAFLMGWPFPNGLALVQRRSPRLVPWAWGVNGFASVAASPLAVLMAIHTGFRAVMLLAGVLYVLAGLLGRSLAGR
jgi:hypothetical protein